MLWMACTWFVYAKLPTGSRKASENLLLGSPAPEQLFGRGEPATEIVDLDLALAQLVAQLVHLAKKPRDLEHHLRALVIDGFLDWRGGDRRGLNRRSDRHLDGDGIRLSAGAAIPLARRRWLRDCVSAMSPLLAPALR